jgi:hypothetical protein
MWRSITALSAFWAKDGETPDTNAAAAIMILKKYFMKYPSQTIGVTGTKARSASSRQMFRPSASG